MTSWEGRHLVQSRHPLNQLQVRPPLLQVGQDGRNPFPVREGKGKTTGRFVLPLAK